MPTGGELLVSALGELGVEVVFGLPGVHNLAAWKGFKGSGIRLVGVRHEQTAGYAADGYARATGRLGVAITTTGPGAANVVTATGEAWACHSPVLVVATDIPTSLRRPGSYRGVLHETTDQASFFRPVTKAVVQATAVDELYRDVLRAGRLALQHPRRPVYLEVPTDLLAAAAEQPAVVGAAAARAIAAAASVDTVVDDRAGATGPTTAASDAKMHPAAWPDAAALAEALAAAERPLLWAGGGATADDAGTGVEALARRLGAPVLTSYGGRGLLPPDSPSLVPLPPHVPEAGALWDAADVVLVLGSDLDAMNTQGFRQPQPPTLLSIGLGEIVSYKVARTWACPVAAGVASLLSALPGPDRPPWSVRPPGREAYAGEGIAFLDALEAGIPDDAVVVADMCVAGYWCGGFGRVSAPRGLAYPVGWGTLGFGFPAALGAALSGRPTVAVVGDGGFLFACGDLATAAQERLPVTVMLVDDGGYGMLRYDFTVHGEDPVGTELEPPDFVALAAAFRVEAREVTLDGLSEAVAAGIASGRPNLIVLKATLPPPPNTSPNWYRAHG